MNEKNLSLAHRLPDFRQMSLKAYRREVGAQIDKLRRDLAAAELRAELAERQVRQFAAERDLWKHQAQEAEAALKSTGRAP